MLSTTIVKGSPEYQVTDGSGRVIARAHCVNVAANLFTLVINDRWAGVLPQAQAVEHLQGLAQ